MELKEEIFPEQSPHRVMHKLTKVWFALFVFTLALNAIPYIPFLSSVGDEAQLVAQTNHSAICSSQWMHEAAPQGAAIFLTETTSASIPGTLKIQEALCSFPILSLISSADPRPHFFVVEISQVPTLVFFAAHPSRGPPRV
jgi:hypothetical protein